MACCTHGVRRILLLVEEWEGTFFKPSQRTRGNTLLGSFYRKCGRRFQHSLESKAGEDSESFYRKSRQDVPPRVGRTALAPSRNADSCHLFLQTIGGIILASAHDNLGGLSSSISSKVKDGEGSLALSHNVE